MTVLVVVGSRNPKGQTSQAAEALLQGVRDAGAEGSVRMLPEARIERCRQCNADGWGRCRAEGHCVIEDDLPVLAEQIRGADAVAFLTPVYFGDLAESMRAFLDRLRRVCRHDEGKAGIAGKRALGVCVAGGGGGGAPSCAVALERALTSTGFDVVDMIPARRQNLAHKLAVLRLSGAWFAVPPV